MMGHSIFGACLDAGYKKPQRRPTILAERKAQLPSQPVPQLEPGHFSFRGDFLGRKVHGALQVSHWRELSATESPGRALAAAA